MNRAERRAAAKRDGVAWADVRRARKAQAIAHRLTPAQAREALARWAAKQHSQTEVARLNGVHASDRH